MYAVTRSEDSAAEWASHPAVVAVTVAESTAQFFGKEPANMDVLVFMLEFQDIASRLASS